MGLQGQLAIIVLMDQQQSENTQSTAHSRSELRQGQLRELEPGLSELDRFRNNALVFVFSLNFFFFAYFYVISFEQGKV